MSAQHKTDWWGGARATFNLHPVGSPDQHLAPDAEAWLANLIDVVGVGLALAVTNLHRLWYLGRPFAVGTLAECLRRCVRRPAGAPVAVKMGALQ
jgi:hypothetical protein